MGWESDFNDRWVACLIGWARGEREKDGQLGIGESVNYNVEQCIKGASVNRYGDYHA